MKVLLIANGQRFRNSVTDPAFYEKFELVEVPVERMPSKDMIALCPDADVIIVDAISTVDKELIDGLPNLKVIHSEGVGFNGVDVAAATARNIPVCNCKGMNAKPVAELAVMHAIALLRGAVTGHNGFLEGHANDIKLDHMRNSDLLEIADCKIGLLGFGDIAKEAAKIFSTLGAEVYYYDMFRATPEVEAECNATYVSQEELIQMADILSLHVPVTKGTFEMVNHDLISSMKPGSYIINTARGELIQENDLVEAIRDGHLAGAALDTVSNEPVGPDHLFLQQPKEVSDKMIFSCHVGGITKSSFRRGAKMLVENMSSLAKGRPLINVVNRV